MSNLYKYRNEYTREDIVATTVAQWAWAERWLFLKSDIVTGHVHILDLEFFGQMFFFSPR